MFPREFRQHGFSLIEVMIAMLIVSFMAIVFVSSIVFMVNQAKTNRLQMDAVRIAEKYQNLAMTARYSDVGKSGLGSSADAYLFRLHDGSNPLVVESDTAYPEYAAEYEVFFAYTGFGDVKTATDKTVTIEKPPGAVDWVADEWADNYVTVTRGPARGEIMRIVSNTATTLTVTADLSGEDTSKGYKVVPTDKSKIVINNGKTIRIYVRWGPENKKQTIQRSVLLPFQGA